MHKPLVVIKLGGSALTDKNRIYTPRLSVIRSAAKQVAEISKSCSVVLVHGAGSYGHIPVRKFGLQHGFKRPSQVGGLAETKFKLLEWEKLLDKMLLKRNIPIVPLLASDFILTKNGRIASAELGPMASWLRLGCVPITGGDIVPDVHKGFAILSGDQIAAFIAIRFRAKRLVYALDVDGIFDANPNLHPRAHLLGNLTPLSASNLMAKASSGTTPDVTGGMAGKIREAVQVAKHRIPVYFVRLTKNERLRKAALGQPVLCSRIEGP